jgi:hypothetical protein
VSETFGLLQLEGEHRKKGILALVPDAWITPQSTVTDWDIVPAPYEILAEKDGFVIFHRPFNAVIPVQFASRDALNDALSQLLIGGVVKGGDADFTHQHQPFKLLAPFSISVLPTRPVLGTEVDDLQATEAIDTAYEFIEGFTPVPRELYNQIVSLRMSWQATSKAASTHLYSVLSSLPIHRFALESLNGAPRDMSDVADVVAELRGCYQELGMLTETELYDRFDSYQSECHFVNGWGTSRDDDFLLYLIGQAASKDDLEGEAAREVGRIAAFLALLGQPLRIGVCKLGDDLANLLGEFRHGRPFHEIGISGQGFIPRPSASVGADQRGLAEHLWQLNCFDLLRAKRHSATPHES